MFNNIVELGYGLIVFAIVLGVGSVVIYNFGGATAVCTGTETGTPVWNSSAGGCWNGTDTATPTGAAYTNTNYVLGQLGSSGLAGWVPAIIAISVGLLFLGFFAINKGRKGKY